MAQNGAGTTWRAAGKSVLGAQHARRGLPNQDALSIWPQEGSGSPLVVALSDGHGSTRSFRSATGARLACETATQVLLELAHAPRDLFPLDLLERGASELLPGELVRRWQGAVREHLAGLPFSEQEWAVLDAEGRGARQTLETNPLLAYGATLLAAAVDEDYILFAQLGDGDILVVREEGVVARPLPGDMRLFANETTSLCLESAARDLRVSFCRRDGDDPTLVLLSTDGYANSFRTDADFLQVGPDLLAAMGEAGVDAVAARFEEWLSEASAAGSGDDITLAMLVPVTA